MTIKKIQNKNYKAFSFIEVIISVFLITVGMMAVVSLISSTLSNSIDSRNQVIASLLAQEGTELVRNIRDSNWEKDVSSFTGIPNGANCAIDYDTIALSCPPAVSNALQIDGNGFYNHSSVTDARFWRRIIISGTTDRIVASLVSWNGSLPPATIGECNTSSKCAFTQVTLGIFGE